MGRSRHTEKLIGWKFPKSGDFELELELIQAHMAQKPVLRGEVGCACVAREVSVERDFQVMTGAQTLSGRILAGSLVPELKSGLKCPITSLHDMDMDYSGNRTATHQPLVLRYQPHIYLKKYEIRPPFSPSFRH